MTLGERLIERIERASLDEIARGAFLVDTGEAAGEGTRSA